MRKSREKEKLLLYQKQLKPDQEIIQGKLAKEPGISHNPLPSRLRILASESSIKSIPLRGALVIPSGMLADKYGFRKILVAG